MHGGPRALSVLRSLLGVMCPEHIWGFPALHINTFEGFLRNISTSLKATGTW